LPRQISRRSHPARQLRERAGALPSDGRNRPAGLHHPGHDRPPGPTGAYSERLLLPFSRDGETVDRILASFEFICPDGAFDNYELMKAPSAPPMLRLSATIAPQAIA
jgi:hypothetical protein